MFLDGTLPTTHCWMTVFPAARWLTALPPSFFSTPYNMDYEQLYTEFNVGAARQICLESEVRSRAEHELELKEKLKGKYDARGRLLEEKDMEILRLKSLLVEEAEKAERAETAKVVRLRGQVSALTGEVSVLKSTVAQKDTDISLLDSRATYLKSALDDSKAAYAEAGSLITSLTSKRDRLTSEDFKEKAEAQQEEQAQVLYNRVTELEAHIIDVSDRLEGEFYPAYLTTLAGRRWFLTHGIQLAVLKCFKSPEYQSILGHALGRAVDFGKQEGLEAGYEHGVAGTLLFVIEAYNPEAASTSYLDTVKALEDVDFHLVNLLKSKRDAGMDEVLDCFTLDRPLADLPEAAHLQPCLERLFVPIHHSDDKAIVGETSLSFALLNVHSRAEGAKKHAAALRQLMMEIVSNPLSSQTWVGETSTSAAPLSVEDFDEVDTDKVYFQGFHLSLLGSTSNSPKRWHAYISLGLMLPVPVGLLNIPVRIALDNHGSRTGMHVARNPFMYFSKETSLLEPLRGYLLDGDYPEATYERFFTPICSAIRRPAINASYSASLFVASNVNLMAYVNSTPSGLLFSGPRRAGLQSILLALGCYAMSFFHLFVRAASASRVIGRHSFFVHFSRFEERQ
ncbi:hypothetical protein Tco_1447650 [Tanacetum coccineum]